MTPYTFSESFKVGIHGLGWPPGPRVTLFTAPRPWPMQLRTVRAIPHGPPQLQFACNTCLSFLINKKEWLYAPLDALIVGRPNFLVDPIIHPTDAVEVVIEIGPRTRIDDDAECTIRLEGLKLD